MKVPFFARQEKIFDRCDRTVGETMQIFGVLANHVARLKHPSHQVVVRRGTLERDAIGVAVMGCAQVVRDLMRDNLFCFCFLFFSKFSR